MKNIAAIIFTLLVLIACSKEKTETVKMGNKDSNLLEIKNFSESKKPKNIGIPKEVDIEDILPTVENEGVPDRVKVTEKAP